MYIIHVFNRPNWHNQTTSASVEPTQTRHSRQNSPLTPIVTKILFPLFSAPPGSANPQKGRRHIGNQSTPAYKIWLESARGLSRNRWQKSEQKTYSKTNTSPFAVTSEWRVTTKQKTSSKFQFSYPPLTLSQLHWWSCIYFITTAITMWYR